MSHQLSFLFARFSLLLHLPNLAIEMVLACHYASSCLPQAVSSALMLICATVELDGIILELFKLLGVLELCIIISSSPLASLKQLGQVFHQYEIYDLVFDL